MTLTKLADGARPVVEQPLGDRRAGVLVVQLDHLQQFADVLFVSTRSSSTGGQVAFRVEIAVGSQT
jgi:hypothetical protein